MAQQASAARAVDLTALVGAAAVLLAIVAVVASTLVVGVVQEARRSLDRSHSCPSSMDRALTSDGDLACLPRDAQPPRGWIALTD